MLTLQIECPCGRHYAFDVEPVNRRVASPVACPSCGADGTAAANEIIARKLPPPFSQPPAREVSASSFRGERTLRTVGAELQSPSATAEAKVDARTLELNSRATAEARAKISWGDSEDEVINYLMLQGFSAPQASELVNVLIKERLAELRAKGTKKIVAGVALICVPITAWSAHLPLISLKAMGAAFAVGLWGGWLVMNGIILVIAPKMESGDVAEK